MIRYREMPPVRVIQDHVASFLPVEDKADSLKCFHCITARDDGKRGHLCSDADFYDVWGWNGKLLCLAQFNDAFYSFLDIFQRLFTRLALRDTARKGGTLCDDIPVLSFDQRDQILVRHVVSPVR